MARMYSVFILMCVNSITLYLSIFANAAPTVRLNDSDVDNSLHRNNIFLRKPVLEISKRQENDLICEHFPSPCSDNSGLTNCTSRKKCSEMDAYCYTSWTLSDEDKTTETGGIRYQWGSKPQHMGCMVPNSPCNKTCVHDTKPNEKHNHLYCCCSEDSCNSKFAYKLPPPTVPKPSTRPPPPQPEPKNESHILIIIGLVSISIVLAAVAAIAFCVYKRKRNQLFDALPQDPADGFRPSDPLHNQNSALPLREIQLQEIKARGRFGAVWKGIMTYRETDSNEEIRKTVAVKIFPMQDKNSWQAEQEIYNLPRMDHESILKFIQCERRGENLAMEYWLTTEFHEYGSLCDFLKSHVVSWNDLCKIARTMAAGLTHLHEELSSQGTLDMKPAIAHRDFKSKNVLIKSDLTACLADFGLALIFEPGKSCGDTHGQVGTRRYMAPEVLEGAINFSRDAFLRIDMYACGLVLWELVSRCTAIHSTSNFTTNGNESPNLNTHSTLTANPGGVGSVVSNPSGFIEYKLPFETDELKNPTLEDMQDLVVNRKVRPVIHPSWRQHSGINALCNTIEECWDQDAEARVSASCVMERIKTFQYLDDQHHRQVNEDRRTPNSTSENIVSAQIPTNNRNDTRISPTDQRMNALNNQETAEQAALILNQASSPITSTSRNFNSSTNPVRNVVPSSCDNPATNSEDTPLLYMGESNTNTSNNNNLSGSNHGFLPTSQIEDLANVQEDTEDISNRTNSVEG